VLDGKAGGERERGRERRDREGGGGGRGEKEDGEKMRLRCRVGSCGELVGPTLPPASSHQHSPERAPVTTALLQDEQKNNQTNR